MSGRIFVVGSVNADLIIEVPQLPSPGETVIGTRMTQAQGGKGANQAVAASLLACPTSLIGAVGTDAFGDDAISSLAESGVDVRGVVRVDEPTGVAIVMVCADGENTVAVVSGANDRVTADQVRDHLNPRLGAGDVVVTNLELKDDAVAAAAEAAYSHMAYFVLNAAPARKLSVDLLRYCDVLTANADEVINLGFDSPAALLSTGARAIVVTRGGDGADLYRAGTPTVHQDAFPVVVVDTTGAGDAFTAALACGIVNGQKLEASLQLATAAGSLATRALGARTADPTMEEIKDLLRNGAG